jgi:hypothetical protein
MILKMTIRVAAFAALILLSTGYLSAQDSTSVAYSVAHSVITQGNGKLAIVDKSGKIDWQMKWGGIHDIHMLKSGNILTRQGRSKVVEIDREKNRSSGATIVRFEMETKGSRSRCMRFSLWPAGIS